MEQRQNLYGSAIELERRERLAAFLRYRRIEAKLTQEEFAAQIDLHFTQYGWLEQARSNVPITAKTKRNLIAALALNRYNQRLLETLISPESFSEVLALFAELTPDTITKGLLAIAEHYCAYPYPIYVIDFLYRYGLVSPTVSPLVGGLQRISCGTNG